jgi:hypothetical protein
VKHANLIAARNSAPRRQPCLPGRHRRLRNDGHTNSTNNRRADHDDTHTTHVFGVDTDANAVVSNEEAIDVLFTD